MAEAFRIFAGMENARTIHDVAHCIANDYAYGTQAPFYEQVERIAAAIKRAVELEAIAAAR